jgi:hypothetical protein
MPLALSLAAQKMQDLHDFKINALLHAQASASGAAGNAADAAFWRTQIDALFEEDELEPSAELAVSADEAIDPLEHMRLVQRIRSEQEHTTAALHRDFDLRALLLRIAHTERTEATDSTQSNSTASHSHSAGPKLGQSQVAPSLPSPAPPPPPPTSAEAAVLASRLVPTQPPGLQPYLNATTSAGLSMALSKDLDLTSKPKPK